MKLSGDMELFVNCTGSSSSLGAINCPLGCAVVVVDSSMFSSKMGVPMSIGDGDGVRLSSFSSI